MKEAVYDREVHALTLPPGTLLDRRYRILDVLNGASAFAVTYRARDVTDEQDVVVKEFLPRALVSRSADHRSIRAHSPDDRIAFARCRRRFAREAELLADIGHANLPRIRAHFSANGTAYLVADYCDGVSLVELAATSGGRVAADLAVSLTMQVLDALQALHAEGLVHASVAPDNIRVTPDSRAILLGLGTTRHVLGDGKAPAAGFAPIEQYGSREVGPWTDVYSCGAVLYTMLNGAPPPSAIERAAGQQVTPPRPGASDAPTGLARVMMGALAHLPGARPHSAEELRRRLEAAVCEPRDRHPGAWESTHSLVVPTAQGLNAIGDRDAASLPLSALDMSDDFGDPPGRSRWAGPLQGLLAAAARTGRDRVGVIIQSFGDGSWRNGVAQIRRPSVAAGVVGVALLLMLGAIAVRGESRASPDGFAPSPTASRLAFADPALSAALPGPAIGALSVTGPASVTRPFGASLDSAAPGLVSDMPAPVEESSAPAGSGAATDARDESPAADDDTPARAEREAPVAVDITAVPAISLALPPASARADAVPFRVESDVRERIARAAVMAEFGDYAGARRAYAAVGEFVAQLERRYPGAGVLATARRDVARAIESTRRACAAENVILRARKAAEVQCE